MWSLMLLTMAHFLPQRKAICSSIYTPQGAPHPCLDLWEAPADSCRDTPQGSLHTFTLLGGLRRLEQLLLLVTLTFFFHKCFFHIFYCRSSTVDSIFSPPVPPTPAIPTSHPVSVNYPLWAFKPQKHSMVARAQL